MTNHNFLSSNKQELEDSLKDLNRRMEEEEAAAKASSLGLPYINLRNFPIDLNVLGLFTEAEARGMGAVPFYKDHKDLRVGTTNPGHPLLAEKLREFKAKHNVSLYFISNWSLLQVLQFYKKVLRPKEAKDDTVRVEKEMDFFGKLKELNANAAGQAAHSASELLQIIFGAAMFYKSSDIHFEPEGHFVKVRFRVDGVLQDVLHLDKALQKPLTTRVKILSKLILNIDTVPQDGRLSFFYLGQAIDVRISCLPSVYGEELVMRLLGTSATDLKLKDLGFRKEYLEKIERQLNKPNGMIITTGPTGSGKTTTLYAFLNELNKPGVKIITLEDPVEYKLEGIIQTPIDHNHDFDFAKGLRAILRQDPDIVMVGEIRDQETAEVAMQAALTGHQVFSTLHTNDSSGAIPRLLNMGIKPFIIAPAISCVLAQRLVRRLCPNCKKPASLSPTVLEKVQYLLKQIPPAANIQLPEELNFYHGLGCGQCRGLGYQGRVGIYEVLEVTEEVQKIINSEKTNMSDYRKAAKDQGMVTLVQDGLLKALEGITDVEEVFRVAGEN